MMTRRAFLSGFLTAGTILGQSVPPLAAQAVDGLSAREFGITPGGGDQTAQVQRLLDTAARSYRTALLPAGDIAVSSLVLPEGVRVVGAGAATRLIQTGRGPMVTGRGLVSAELADMALVGSEGRSPSEAGLGLVDLRQVNWARLTGLTLSGALADGVYMEQCGGTVSDCRIEACGRFGVFSMEGDRLIISRNTVRQCANGGIILHRWQVGPEGARIIGNRISDIGAAAGGTGQWGNGINIYLGRDVQISRNHISRCAFSAMRANSAHDFSMHDNQCFESGEMAIFAEFAWSNGTITRNLVDGAANGISATNFNDGGHGGLIADNHVRNLRLTGPYEPDAPGFGIGISAEADCEVVHNTVENAPRIGLLAGWGPYLRNCTLRNNLVRSAGLGIGISVADGAGRVTVDGNRIVDTQTAIAGMRWADIVTQDLARRPQAAPATITLGTNQIA